MKFSSWRVAALVSVATASLAACSIPAAQPYDDPEALLSGLGDGFSCDVTNKTGPETIDGVPEHTTTKAHCVDGNEDIEIEVRVSEDGESLESFVSHAENEKREGYHLSAENWVVSTLIYSRENEDWANEARRQIGGELTGVPPEDVSGSIQRQG